VDSTYDAVIEKTSRAKAQEKQVLRISLRTRTVRNANRVYVETIETGKMEFGVAERGL
jgi:ABC-type multidrug transport system fused ATPase/permease subunit